MVDQLRSTRASTATAPSGGAFLFTSRAAAEVLIPEGFSDELRMFASSAKTFVHREITPDLERLEALDYELSRAKMRKAGELGLLGVEVPEEFGGLASSKAASAVVVEALATTGSFNVTYNAHSGIGTLPLVYFGSAEQKARYLPKLASGEWVAAYCLTETGSGSDSLAAKTRAVLDGDEWVLDGAKMWISNAGFADLFTVFAKVDGEQFSAFLVERGTPGLSFGAEEKKMGIKGSSTRMVILDGVRVPRENLLGEVGKGHLIAFGILNLGRFKLAVGATGGAKQLIAQAQAYARERRQFGASIAEFGLIKEKIGAMVANTFALESAVYRLAGDMDSVISDLRAGAEAEGGSVTPAAELAALNEYAVEYSFIKVFGSEILDEVVDETLQVFGGYGFSADYPIEAAYRNSRINRIFEGTNEINRELTVDQLLKRTKRGQLDLLAPAQAAMMGDAAAALGRSDAGEGRAAEVTAAGQTELSATTDSLKLATLQLLGLTAMAYVEGLEHEQELLARLADMIGSVYLAESAALRAERLAERSEGATAIAAARLFQLDAVDGMRQAGREVLARLPRGSQSLPRFLAYLGEPAVDRIALRRQLAEAAYDADGYPFAGV